MIRLRWRIGARRRRPAQPQSRKLLRAALVLAGALAVAKAGFLIQGFGFEIAVRTAAHAEQEDGAREILPEPEAGPNDIEPAIHGEEEPSSAAWASTSAPMTRDLDPAELDASEREILEALAARRAALDEQARELDIRAAVLETAEARLALLLEQLAKLHAAIAIMVEAHDAAEAEKLARLVKIYETMKPKAAAEIFDRLEMGVLLRVVSQMREAKASAVIARMNPKRAEQLTAELALLTDLPEAVP